MTCKDTGQYGDSVENACQLLTGRFQLLIIDSRQLWGREGKGDHERGAEDEVLFLTYIHVHVVELTISGHFCSYTVERPAEETVYSIV